MTGESAITPADDLLLAEYVIGVLPHDELVALARRIAGDDALEARVRYWESELAPLGDGVEEIAPPARVLAAIEHRLFPAAASPAGIWHSLGFWRGLAAVLGVVLLLGGGLAVMRPWQHDATPPATYVAEVTGADNAVRLAVLYDAATGQMKLNRLTGPSRAGRDFELWLVQDGAPPLSLGILPRPAMASLALPADTAAKLAAGAVLAVSDEPEGGSPTGQPTGAVLATGALTPI